MLEQLSRISLFRRLVIPLLRRFNIGDIRIGHHYVDRRILLHSFRHKGYWFHGRRREQETMETLQRLVKPSDCVIEVGGHIGYLTVFFSQLVGPQGKVVVLEPGTNNLPYLRENIAGLENTLLIEKAASDKNGSAHFLLENLSGQNNTLVDGFEGLRGNISEAHVRVEQRSVVVETVRLDDLIESHQIVPNWVKIDVEGAELSVLIGMRDCLKRHSPSMMIEIAYNKREIFNLLRGDDYQLFSPCLQRIKDHKELGGEYLLPAWDKPPRVACPYGLGGISPCRVN